MKKRNILWLDDDTNRADSSSYLEVEINHSVRFIDLKHEDLTKKLSEILRLEEPALIILDHNLQDVQKSNFKKGSTVAAIFREAWPDCPIICITGEETSNLNTQQRHLYDEVYPFDNFSKFINNIRSIILSYKAIKKQNIVSINDFLSILKCPEIDHLNLITIIPAKVKDHLNKPGIIFEMSNWVRHTLIERPGFLIDQLWLATLVGIKSESFYKIEKRFITAKYSGIFSSESEPRWWKSQAIEILFKLSSSSNPLPWENALGIKGIGKDDLSECYVSGEPFPEVVAFVDTTDNALEVPVKQKYTTLHPDFESMLFFEDIRLMQESDEHQ